MIFICLLSDSMVRCTVVLGAAFLLLPLTSTSSLAQSPETVLQTAIDSLSAERMLADIRTLSGPSFNGRQSGTKADLESARWVAQEFLSAGLRLSRIRNGSLIVPFLTGKDGT